MPRYVIGLDFGTNSCRSLIVNAGSGRELASHVFPYPSGTDGVILEPSDPSVARWSGPMHNLMKELLDIRDTVRRSRQ